MKQGPAGDGMKDEGVKGQRVSRGTFYPRVKVKTHKARDKQKFGGRSLRKPHLVVFIFSGRWQAG